MYHVLRLKYNFYYYIANRAISRDDIHCVLALTAARPAMHKLVCQC